MRAMRSAGYHIPLVMPAQAGIHACPGFRDSAWTPAFAGVTIWLWMVLGKPLKPNHSL